MSPVADSESATGKGTVAVPAALHRAQRAGAAVATALFLLVLVNWSWHLQPTRYTSNFFDVQARSLFHGRLDVPLDQVGLEAFDQGGTYHLYFGLFPSLLRMPVLLVTDRFDGRLTQPSMLLAWVLLLVAVAGLTWRVRLLVRGSVDERPLDRADRVIAFGAPLLVLAATPVLFLSSVTAVYHEAILWGLAASLLAFDRLLVLLAVPTGRNVLWFAVAAVVAVSSRAALGIAPCATAALIAALALLGRARALAPIGTRTDRLARRLAIPALDPRIAFALGASTVVAVAAHVIVNEARFGTLFSPPFANQVWTTISEARRAALDANGGSVFNVGYIPSTLLAYLRPDGFSFERAFPYVWFDPPARVVGSVVFENRDRTASLTSVSPLYVLASLGGLISITRAVRDRTASARLALPVVASLGAAFGVLTIGSIAQRYEGDLLLPGALLALAAVHLLADRLPSARRTRTILLGGVSVLLAWSVWANLSIALLYQRLYVPANERDRHAFVDLQVALDRVVPGSLAYTRAEVSPQDVSPAGSLHVTRSCDELWWSDGTMWIQLEPLPSGSSPLCRKLTDR